MAIEVTPEAIEVLTRGLELANVDRSTGGVRIRIVRALGGGASAQVEFAAGAEADEDTFEQGDLRFFVSPEVGDSYPDAVLTVDPQHDTIVLRPA